ncbi:translation initiation factor IF-2 [Neosynechococcus sphagnicola]|uniref:translation initiation factor IF-2 n=1 Tax=Neosynechococcus sphagnicola TaxID=1501145 RepID=UPI001EF9E600|nr:translation initiation factor IF-2 [Neosynechococcus sphagnicola]
MPVAPGQSTPSKVVNRQEPGSSPGTTFQPASLSSRPVLKRSRGDQAPSDGLRPTEGTAGTAEPRRLPSRPQASDGTTEERSKPQLTTELPRPRLVRPNLQTDTERGEGSQHLAGEGRRVASPSRGGLSSAPTGLEAAPTVQDLKRPTPPRLAKRGKGWEEEEVDETPDFAEKAAKVSTKAKRRLQPLDEIDIDDIENIEDIEDLEDLDDTQDQGFREEEGVDPAQVSLSIARPPKPKGRPGQARLASAGAALITPKGRKSGGGDDGDRGRRRRDRRGQDATVERPERLILTGSLTVQELASVMMVPEATIIKTLFFKGIAANINQTLDMPTATMLAQELGMVVETPEREAAARKVTEMIDAGDLESLQRRPPVVTIMGHVDHGKTTLLDSIRKTKVAQGEAGGITQHIGAYHVDVTHEGKMQQVVFLDTPGHEAFTAMRARGARVTDIAVLVVAADDGVQPQTIEAISHAKAAEVPMVIAINKIDKPDSQPDRVKQELTEFGLVPEEWGGDTVMVAVSAITGENLDALLEMILLVAEVEDLYANPDRAARGTVIEAHLDKAKGAVATLLIQNGTLRVGDILVAGSALGKVRAMVDDRGHRVEAALPSFAVEVLGLGDVPAAGDEFEVFKDEKEARAIATARTDQQRQSRLQQALTSRRVTLNTLSARAQEGELKELNLIVKADVQGSLEAILGALKQLPQNEVQLRVLFAAPGEVTETDVDLAAASDAVIIGFNTTLASGSRQASDRTGVDIREYNIIYKLLDDIQGAMEGLLDPELVEEALGQAEVRAVFPVGRGAVAGCYILSGKVIRNCKVRVHRGGNKVFEGILDSLKRMKEDAREVNAGYECGIGIDNFKDWVEGDTIEAFRMVSKRRTLSPA